MAGTNDDETLAGSPLSVRYGGLAGQAVELDLAAGRDELVVRGSAAAKNVEVDDGSDRIVFRAPAPNEAEWAVDVAIDGGATRRTTRSAD